MKRRSAKEMALYNDMVAYYESLYALSPLQSRVYVFLLFESKRSGFSFEELIGIFDVSKSSMSSALKSLLASKHIESVQEGESRKRHFQINKRYAIIRYAQILDKLLTEKELWQRFIALKMDHDAHVTSEGALTYITALDRSIESLTKSLNQFKSLTKSAHKV